MAHEIGNIVEENDNDFGIRGSLAADKVMSISKLE